MFLITGIVLFCIVSMVLCDSTRTCARGIFDNVHVNNCSLPICNSAQLALPVPIDACDRSKCLEVPLEQLRNLGTFRAYTWNLGKRFYAGYCPYTADFNISENSDGSLKYIEHSSSGSGLNCSNFTNYLFEFNSPSRLVNGKYKFLQAIQANQTWESCYKLFVPKGPFVDFRCRIDPPPSYGETTARIVAFKPVHGNCSRDESILEKFLQDYLVDWQQIIVDCY